MRLTRTAGMASERHTAEITRLRAFWAPLYVTDGEAAGGGGGGDGKPAGDDGKPAGGEGDEGKPGDGKAGEGKDDSGGAGKYTPKQLEAFNIKLKAEAAALRAKHRESETKVADLQKQIDELKAKPAPPQDDKADSEVAKLQRSVNELSTQLKAERDTLAKERASLKAEKINGTVAALVTDGKFILPKVMARILRDAVDIDADGAPVLLVTDEDGEKVKVKATLDNLLKFKPVDDFDSFLPTSGVSGAGSRGGSGVSGDGIDWGKVKAGDVDYIEKHNVRIKSALNQQ
jgi:hypothetical protein